MSNTTGLTADQTNELGRWHGLKNGRGGYKTADRAYVKGWDSYEAVTGDFPPTEDVIQVKQKEDGFYWRVVTEADDAPAPAPEQRPYWDALTDVEQCAVLRDASVVDAVTAARFAADHGVDYGMSGFQIAELIAHFSDDPAAVNGWSDTAPETADDDASEGWATEGEMWSDTVEGCQLDADLSRALDAILDQRAGAADELTADVDATVELMAPASTPLPYGWAAVEPGADAAPDAPTGGPIYWTAYQDLPDHETQCHVRRTLSQDTKPPGWHEFLTCQNPSSMSTEGVSPAVSRRRYPPRTLPRRDAGHSPCNDTVIERALGDAMADGPAWPDTGPFRGVAAWDGHSLLPALRGGSPGKRGAVLNQPRAPAPGPDGSEVETYSSLLWALAYRAFGLAEQCAHKAESAAAGFSADTPGVEGAVSAARWAAGAAAAGAAARELAAVLARLRDDRGGGGSARGRVEEARSYATDALARVARHGAEQSSCHIASAFSVIVQKETAAVLGETVFLLAHYCGPGVSLVDDRRTCGPRFLDAVDAAAACARGDARPLSFAALRADLWAECG